MRAKVCSGRLLQGNLCVCRRPSEEQIPKIKTQMLQKTQQTKNTSQQYENWTTTRYSASRLVYYNTYYNNTGVRSARAVAF